MIEVIRLSDIIKRGNVYQFNKRIPADLQKYFDGAKWKKCSLKTKDRAVAEQKAQDIRDEWESLRTAPQQTKQKNKPITSPFLSTEDLEGIEARFKGKVQIDVGRFNELMGHKLKTLKAMDEESIQPTVRKLEQLLDADSLLQSDLEVIYNPCFLTKKENLYGVCLKASGRDSLSMVDLRRVARKVIVVLIDGYTQMQKMIEAETYRPAKLTDAQKFIDKAKSMHTKKPLPITADQAPKLSEMLEECLQTGTKKSKTKDLMRAAVDTLMEWHGDRDISEYKRADLINFRDKCLLRLPAYRKTRKPWKDFDLRTCCKKKMAEDEAISPKTINNYLAYICSVFSHAYDEHHIDRNPATKLEVEELDDIDRAYAPKELKLLWDNLSFDTQKPSRYWTVLIAMYQGMRLNEICQLHTDDIYTNSIGIDVIDINARGKKKVKNKSSRRVIPIHPKLIELGLMDFVTKRKKALSNKVDLLFCDVNADKYGNYIRNTSYWFNKAYKSKLFSKEKGDQGYHSIRHSFIQQCQNQADMDDRVNEEISGHNPTTVGAVHKKYSREVKAKKMLEQLKMLKYEFE